MLCKWTRAIGGCLIRMVFRKLICIPFPISMNICPTSGRRTCSHLLTEVDSWSAKQTLSADSFLYSHRKLPVSSSSCCLPLLASIIIQDPLCTAQESLIGNITYSKCLEMGQKKTCITFTATHARRVRVNMTCIVSALGTFLKRAPQVDKTSSSK